MTSYETVLLNGNTVSKQYYCRVLDPGDCVERVNGNCKVLEDC